MQCAPQEGNGRGMTPLVSFGNSLTLDAVGLSSLPPHEVSVSPVSNVSHVCITKVGARQDAECSNHFTYALAFSSNERWSTVVPEK